MSSTRSPLAGRACGQRLRRWVGRRLSPAHSLLAVAPGVSTWCLGKSQADFPGSIGGPPGSVAACALATAADEKAIDRATNEIVIVSGKMDVARHDPIEARSCKFGISGDAAPRLKRRRLQHGHVRCPPGRSAPRMDRGRKKRSRPRARLVSQAGQSPAGNASRSAWFLVPQTKKMHRRHDPMGQDRPRQGSMMGRYGSPHSSGTQFPRPTCRPAAPARRCTPHRLRSYRRRPRRRRRRPRTSGSSCGSGCATDHIIEQGCGASPSK